MQLKRPSPPWRRLVSSDYRIVSRETSSTLVQALCQPHQLYDGFSNSNRAYCSLVPQMTIQPIGLKPGIYFNLPNEAYHDDPALSHSGMTKVLVSWPDFWLNSCFNPERKKNKSTDAMEFGQRSGMLLLQPKVFHSTYNTHGKSSPTAKGTWLSSVEWQRLTEGVDAVMDVPIGAQHFRDGYAEVTIVWMDSSGIMLRARIDYLRTFGCIDFKRVAEVNNYAIGRAVKAQGLDIQNFLYLEAVKAARASLMRFNDGALRLKANLENVSYEWLKAFREDTDLLFRFLFQRSTPPYIWEFRELDNEVLVEGGHAVFHAIRRYKLGLKMYGLEKPPMGSNTAKPKIINAYHVPRRDYDYGED